jgi:hypothetical protein
VAADGLTEGGLGGHGDRHLKVLDFQDGLFGVPDDPEVDGVDADGDGVLGEGGLCLDVADADALVDGGADGIDDGDDPEHAGPAHTLEAAETEEGDALPLIGDADRKEEEDGGETAQGEGPGGSSEGSRDSSEQQGGGK